MRILVPAEETPAPPNSNAFPLLAGLLTAAGTAGILVGLIRFPPEWPAPLVATIYIALIVGANALGIRAAGVLRHRNVEGAARTTSAAAAWLAPLAVYLEAESAFAIPVAVAIAAMTVILFRHPEVPPQKETHDDGIFHLLEPPPNSRLRALVWAAVFFQLSLVVGTVGIAAILAATAAAIVAWHVAGPPGTKSAAGSSRQILSSGLTLMLAFLMTAIALPGFGDGNSDRPNSNATASGNGEVNGVFLWPIVPTKPQQLVSPPLSDDPLYYKGRKVPLRIRFDGVYWFFRWPALKPPPGAAIAYGTPDETGFSSTDSTPLLMEAHETLPGQIDLLSCRRVEVAVRNADRYPGTVAVELILTNSAIPLETTLSLGQVKAATTLRLPTPDGHPNEETLSFPVPEYPAITSFDGVTVRFHLQSDRETLSPRMAIDNLLLVPR